MKVALNGLGRIGRTILRILATSRTYSTLEVVACNDIAGAELCAYLLQYDSTFGPLPIPVTYENHRLKLGNISCRFTDAHHLSELDLSDVDIVMDCTGKAVTSDFATAGLKAGASHVLVSGPTPVAETTLVLGANDEVLDGQSIISIGSCTTNALAPLLRLLDERVGLVAGHMTTVHCYTGSQPTIDAPRGGFERSRAASLSMVPTSTSAGQLIDALLPSLCGKISTSAVRVPTASVSAVDLGFTSHAPLNRDALNDFFQRADSNIIGTTQDPVVSSDLRSRPESVIVALPETRVNGAHYGRVFGWYDNEWGFANRMIDVAERIKPA